MSNGHTHRGHDHHEDLADVIMDEAFWNDRYESSSALWSGRPNPQLVAETADLGPGTVLDAGCGEGADAIWLAEHGWQVTAVDISTVALERAAVYAQEAGAEVARRVAWQHADLAGWVPPASTYDLVSVQFMHIPKDQRGLFHQRLAASVSAGGTLLVVGHHPSDLETTIQRPPLPELLFTASEVAVSLDPHGWEILVDEARARPALDPEGRTITVHDAVLKARRIQ